MLIGLLYLLDIQAGQRFVEPSEKSQMLFHRKILKKGFVEVREVRLDERTDLRVITTVDGRQQRLEHPAGGRVRKWPRAASLIPGQHCQVGEHMATQRRLGKVFATQGLDG